MKNNKEMEEKLEMLYDWSNGVYKHIDKEILIDKLDKGGFVEINRLYDKGYRKIPKLDIDCVKKNKEELTTNDLIEIDKLTRIIREEQNSTEGDSDNHWTYGDTYPSAERLYMEQGVRVISKKNMFLSKKELNEIQSNFFDSGIRHGRYETANEILLPILKIMTMEDVSMELEDKIIELAEKFGLGD